MGVDVVATPIKHVIKDISFMGGPNSRAECECGWHGHPDAFAAHRKDVATKKPNGGDVAKAKPADAVTASRLRGAEAAGFVAGQRKDGTAVEAKPERVYKRSPETRAKMRQAQLDRNARIRAESAAVLDRARAPERTTARPVKPPAIAVRDVSNRPNPLTARPTAVAPEPADPAGPPPSTVETPPASQGLSPVPEPLVVLHLLADVTAIRFAILGSADWRRLSDNARLHLDLLSDGSVRLTP